MYIAVNGDVHLGCGCFFAGGNFGLLVWGACLRVDWSHLPVVLADWWISPGSLVLQQWLLVKWDGGAEG